MPSFISALLSSASLIEENFALFNTLRFKEKNKEKRFYNIPIDGII